MRRVDHSASSKFLAPLPGTQGATSRRVPTIANLRSRCRTLVYKIGELHTIFYLCFLVLLVYLSVFTFMSLIKNTKNTCYLVSSYHYGWSFAFGEAEVLTFTQRGGESLKDAWYRINDFQKKKNKKKKTQLLSLKFFFFFFFF